MNAGKLGRTIRNGCTVLGAVVLALALAWLVLAFLGGCAGNPAAQAAQQAATEAPRVAETIAAVTDRPAPKAEDQPDGFATIHWIVYAGAFALMLVGAFLFAVGARRGGLTLAITGLVALLLALAAAYYGQALAFGAFLLLGAGGAMLAVCAGLYAWRMAKGEKQLGQVVAAAEGEGIDLQRLPQQLAEKVRQLVNGAG